MASDDEERMRSDWNSFVTRWPMFEWFEPIEFLGPGVFDPSIEFRSRFPKFSELLARSRFHVIYTDAGSSSQKLSHLHAWTDSEGDTFGWLCESPNARYRAAEPVKSLHVLLESFGGVRETWNVRGDLLANVVQGALARSSSFSLSDAQRLWNSEGHPLRISAPSRFLRRIWNQVCGRSAREPFEYRQWRTFAGEGNGDLHIVHRRTEEVRYAAHDPGLARVRRDDGPFYVLDGVPDLRSWVELVAQQHLDAVA